MIQMIAAQVRAARGLLNWTKEELAENSDISVSTIRKIERGETCPQGVTADKLFRTFDNVGVVFTIEGGVRQERPEVKTLEGEAGTNYVFESFLRDAQKRGEEIIGSFSSKNALLHSFALKIEEAENRLAKLGQHTSMKWMFPDNTSYKGTEVNGSIRYISRRCVCPEARLVCGNKFVMIYNVGQSDHRTIIINEPHTAIATKEHMYSLWSESNEIPASKQAKIRGSI